MSNLFDQNPDHNDTWTNPTTGEEFKFDRHRGWINRKGVRFDGDTMTGTLVVPDTRINGGLLSAPEVEEGGIEVDFEGGTHFPGPHPGDIWKNYGHTTYDNGIFVMGSTSSSVKEIYWSTDAINWNIYAFNKSSLRNGAVTFIEYGGGKWLYKRTQAQDTQLSYSTDNAKTWTIIPDGDPVISSAGFAYVRDVAYGNGKWVGVSLYGNGPYYSDDGITWKVGSAPENTNSWHSVVYGDGKFVAGSRDGPYRTMHSYDGINWSWGAQPPIAQSFEKLIYGDGLFVALHDRYAHYSSDGINWVTAADAPNLLGNSTVNPNPPKWSGFTFGNGLFVASATDGLDYRVMYSKDGNIWQGARINPAGWGPPRLRYATYGDGKFVFNEDGDGNSNREWKALIIDAPEIIEDHISSGLFWNEEEVIVQQSSRTMTSSLTQLTSALSSRTGKVKYLQDSAPPETQTFELSEDSSETIDLTYDNGELWYQPSTNTLHVRDSDDWVALFQ